MLEKRSGKEANKAAAGPAPRAALWGGCRDPAAYPHEGGTKEAQRIAYPKHAKPITCPTDFALR